MKVKTAQRRLPHFKLFPIFNILFNRMNQIEFQHLMNRAGFGCTLEQLLPYSTLGRKEMVNRLFAATEDADDLAAIKRPEVEDIIKELKESDGDTKKMYRKMLVEAGRDLNVTWLKKMTSDKAQLLEKMTFFWHGHFACRDDNPILLQSLNNAIRDNALGKFKNLLIAVAQSPAMLNFLNNQQNRKNAPNENFAREVMELFTLGRGNYTERDVKEAARAFTGWGFEKQTLNFHFRENQHDYNEKEFFGKKGNFDGKDIIDMILYKEECARFIAGKIYQFFVNDERDEKRINDLAEKLYLSDYHIGNLMKEIFTSDWFYDKKNIGTRIKSPVELIVHISRILKPEYGNKDAIVFAQRIMNQVLFLPPNVAGWPNGKRWIDNSNLIFRMDVGRKIVESAEVNERLKADDDNDPNMTMHKEKAAKMKGKLNELDLKINWNELSPLFSSANDEQLFNEAGSVLLVAGAVNYASANFKMKGDNKIQKLKWTISYLMSLPEFQLG